MSQTIEVPDPLFDDMREDAEAQGLSLVGWIASKLPRDGNDPPAGATPPKSLADLFAGRVGTFSSGTGEPSLETLRDSFGDYLEEKHRTGHL